MHGTTEQEGKRERKIFKKKKGIFSIEIDSWRSNRNPFHPEDFERI